MTAVHTYCDESCRLEHARPSAMALAAVPRSASTWPAKARGLALKGEIEP